MQGDLIKLGVTNTLRVHNVPSELNAEMADPHAIVSIVSAQRRVGHCSALYAGLSCLDSPSYK